MNLHEENEIPRYPVFGVDNDEMADYDPSGPPKNGHHYLYNVMSEAARCPATVVADMTLLKHKLKKQNFIIEMEELPKCIPQLLPSPEWENGQVADFSNLRQLISRRRDLEPEPPSYEYELPYIGEQKKWLKFCFESDEHLPTLTLLLSIPQPNLGKLLNIFIRAIQADELQMMSRSSLWFYSLMACLEIPLLPETTASLRNLARLCIIERSKLENPDNDLLKPLNLLICIVTRYFEQYDLLE